MNLANKLTLLRVLMIPVFIVAFLWTGIGHPLPVILFLLASITDTLDGYIARSRNLITTFGKFADPLADKLLVTAALLMVLEAGSVPAWAVFVILAREFIITGFRIVAADHKVTIAASGFGKIKTITQLLAIILLLAGNPPWGVVHGFRLDLILFYISMLLTVASGVDYLYRNRAVLDLKENL